MTGGLLVVSVISALALGRMPAKQALVYQNGVLIRTLDLSETGEPYSFTVKGDSGINVITVERGRVCISDADCHDKSCVRQGWISGGATSIVCLPHALVITLDRGVSSGTNGTDVDAVVG